MKINTKEDQDPRWCSNAKVIGEDLHRLNVEYGRDAIKPYLLFTIDLMNLTPKKLEVFTKGLNYASNLWGNMLEGFEQLDDVEVPSSLNRSYKCFLSAKTLVEDLKCSQGLDALEPHQLKKLQVDLYNNLMNQGTKELVA